jgi:outer membrane receptor protein involved in Fe transport
MYTWSGGSDDEPYVTTQNGFIQNNNAGLQYNNKWHDKKTLSISPKLNTQVYNNNRQVYTQSQVENVVLNELAFTNTYVNRYNIKTSGVYDVKLDSNNTLKLTLRANFYHTESEESGNSVLTGSLNQVKNTTENNVQTVNDKESFSTSAIFKHKFKKARRTLSLNVDWNLLNSDGNNITYALNQFYDNNNAVIDSLEQNNMRENIRSTQKIATRAVYTEPLTKKLSLELAHELSYTSGNNYQITYSYSPVSNKFDSKVDSLTNDFDQSIVVNKPSFKINYAEKKIKYNVGAGFGLTHFNLSDNTLNKNYIRNYINFFPTSNFTYTYKSNHSIRVNYNGSTTQPTINQLQPLRNNSNFINQYIGNPDLKPSFSNTFNISHNGYNFIKDRWTYQSLNIRMTSNSINNNRQ